MVFWVLKWNPLLPMQESVFMQTFLTSQVHLAVKRTGNQKLGNYKVGVICLDIIPNSHDLWSCSWLWRGLREGFVGARNNPLVKIFYFWLIAWVYKNERIWRIFSAELHLLRSFLVREYLIKGHGQGRRTVWVTPLMRRVEMFCFWPSAKHSRYINQPIFGIKGFTLKFIYHSKCPCYEKCCVLVWFQCRSLPSKLLELDASFELIIVYS